MMSRALVDLDELLSDPQFWEDELFLELDDLVSHLDDQDVADLFRMRQARAAEWRENLGQAVSCMAQPSVCEAVFDLLRSDDPVSVSDGFQYFMTRTWPASWIGEPELDTLETLWRTHADWRVAIQQALWKAGRSGQLRRRLGLVRWSDSKKFEGPDSTNLPVE